MQYYYKYNPIYFPHNTIYNNHCNDQKSSIVFLHNSRTVTVTLDSPFITREDHGNIVVTVSLNTPNETDSTLVDVRTLDSSTTGKNCCLCIKRFSYKNEFKNITVEPSMLNTSKKRTVARQK